MLKYNFEYDKLKLKQVIVLIPKNHTNLNSLLTPILGLYGLDVKNFITVFEKITSHITGNLVIPLRVLITKIKTFDIQLLTPYLGGLLSVFNNITYKLDYNLLIIYKFFLLKSIILSSYFRLSLFFYKNIRNYLLNFCWKNKVFFKISSIPIVFENYKKYGLVLNFNNISNTYLNVLKTAALLFNLTIKKLNNSLISSNNILKIKTNNYIIGSNLLINFFRFFKNIKFNTTIGCLPLFVKYKNNLINIDFYNKRVLYYNYNITQFLRLLTYQYIKIMKINIKKNINFLNICRLINN